MVRHFIDYQCPKVLQVPTSALLLPTLPAEALAYAPDYMCLEEMSADYTTTWSA